MIEAYCIHCPDWVHPSEAWVDDVGHVHLDIHHNCGEQFGLLVLA